MVSSFHSATAATRALERQMRNWELAKAQQHTSKKPDQELHHFVTISQMVGAGAEAIAERLGQSLGWPCFDKQLLLAMAADDDIRARLYASMDERDLSWFELTFRTFGDSRLRKADYFHRLGKTVLCLVRKGNAVFLGRAVDMILPRGLGLRVRIVAPSKQRIDRIAQQQHLSEMEASREITRLEKEQDAWIRNHFRITAEDCTRFDLGLNTAAFNIEQMLQLILDAMRQRGIPVETT